MHDDKFTLFFKNPLIYGDDLLYLSKLQPTYKQDRLGGEIWRYVFYKVTAKNERIKPEIKFYWEMQFDQNQRLISCALSPLFLSIAPAEFLEVSIKSIATAKINATTKQVRSNLDLLDKVSTKLPLLADIKNNLGKPKAIEDRKNKFVYIYHFILDSPDIKAGYEKRALSKIKLYFDKNSQELIKMSGRFAGLKISIDYSKLVKKHL